MMRIKRQVSYLVSLLHLTACVTKPMPTVTEAQRLQMGKVAVVTISALPKSKLDPGPIGSGDGAASGAGSGALGGLKMIGSAGSGDGAVVAILLLPVFVVGGATYGAISGAIKAISTEKAESIENRFRTVLGKIDVQKDLRAEIINSVVRNSIQNVIEKKAEPEKASDNSTIGIYPSQGDKVDTVLEVGVISAKWVDREEQGGEDPTLALEVNAMARLIRANTQKEYYRNDLLTFNTVPRKFSEWDSNSTRLLKDEIARACQTLGNTIVEEVFLTVRTE